jgi:hypothetical protein
LAVQVQVESQFDVVFGFPAVGANCGTGFVADYFADFIASAVDGIPLVPGLPKAVLLQASTTCLLFFPLILALASSKVRFPTEFALFAVTGTIALLPAPDFDPGA